MWWRIGRRQLDSMAVSRSLRPNRAKSGLGVLGEQPRRLPDLFELVMGQAVLGAGPLPWRPCRNAEVLVECS